MDLLTPVDTDRFFSVPLGLVDLRPVSVLMQPMARDPHDARNPVGVAECISDSEIRAPRVTQHDPPGHPECLADVL
jgi:hypothetical protein